jgi:hypothetical protein
MQNNSIRKMALSILSALLAVMPLIQGAALAEPPKGTRPTPKKMKVETEKDRGKVKGSDMAPGGPIPFRPSEKIGADQAVAFPVDI